MPDLRNTIAHILEHKQLLVEANEATIQQYVVLPILRALGWNDTNLASMEILPEYKVESRRADYALHVKQKQDPVVLIECKRWNQAIGRNEEQICFYAYSGNVPLAIITNGKLWRFYLSRWEASSLSDRIFCETDIGDREDAVSNLEKYLLKSNVESGEAERKAKRTLKEKEKTVNPSEPVPVNTSPDTRSNIIDAQLAKENIISYLELSGEWTIERVKNSLSQKLRAFFEKAFSEERLELFYRGIAEVLNLIEKKKEWKQNLNPAKVSKMLCGFWLTNKGTIGNIKRIFGILPQGRFPVEKIVGKDGELIEKVQALPRIFVRITKEEAEQLERQNVNLDGCKFYGVQKDKLVDYVYYDIPENMLDLLPVLECAYNKHRGS